MRNYLTFLLGLAFALFSPFSVLAQQIEKPNVGPDTPASPEMARLWNAFGGDWDNTEAMERSEFFPNGGTRTGTSRWRLAIGGTIVIDEGHSDGSARPLDHLLLFWWDKEANIYRLFVCFKDQASACEVRGTAHWEGKSLVNDYEETVHGKLTKMKDSFIEITPSAHTLVAAIDSGNGGMKTLITTRSVRRRKISGE